jgi:multiple sugar transport system permease protein
MRRQSGVATILLAPFFALFAAFSLIPIGYAAYLSLFTERSSGLGFGGTETVFTGLDNFGKALSDATFRDGFLHVAIYCFVYIPALISLGLVFALMLDSAFARLKRLAQLALYLPNLAPGLVAAVIWLYLYTPGLSPVVKAFESLGFTWNLNSAASPFAAMANIAIWSHVGYNTVIFFAALQAIPREVLEASTVDGAGAIRTAWSVKLPMIRNAIVLAGLFTIVGAVQLFTEPQLLVSRLPISSSWTPTMYIYHAAFDQHNYGLAAAASLLLAVVVGLASFLVTRIGSRSRA